MSEIEVVVVEFVRGTRCGRCNKRIFPERVKIFHVVEGEEVRAVCHWECLTMKEQNVYMAEIRKNRKK